MPEVKKKNLDPMERDGLIEEYKALRDEIVSAKSRRLQTISLTVEAFGVIHHPKAFGTFRRFNAGFPR
jgi:hypothetical protein